MLNKSINLFQNEENTSIVNQTFNVSVPSFALRGYGAGDTHYEFEVKVNIYLIKPCGQTGQIDGHGLFYI